MAVLATSILIYVNFLQSLFKHTQQVCRAVAMDSKHSEEVEGKAFASEQSHSLLCCF